MLAHQQKIQEQHLSEMGDMDTKEKDRLIAEFEEDKVHITTALLTERDRQQAKLQAKLTKRRTRRKHKQEAKLNEELAVKQEQTQSEIDRVTRTTKKQVVWCLQLFIFNFGDLKLNLVP
jgi:hypothetical protein